MKKVYKRNVAVAIILSIITLGIYEIYWKYLMVKNIRTLKGDFRNCTGEMLCLVFVPFYSLYWWYNRGSYVKSDIKSNTGGIVYLLLALFGLEIIALAVMQDEFNHSPYGKSMSSMSTRRLVGNIVVYVILVAITIVWLAPFVGIVLESFKTETNMQTGYLFPKVWGFKHYIRLFTETDFLKWFGNTAVMGVATAILQTVFVLAMSYVLSRMRFKGRKPLMNFMLILGMFPGFLTLILIYKVFATKVGGSPILTESMAPLGLIIVYCASSAMGYYVSKGFFDTIPKSLDEAARVDGATRFQVFYKVIMPLAKPIVIYTILIGFMAPWGDFMMASYLIHENSQGMNVAVGMFEWLSVTNLNTHYTMFCAAGVIVAIPVVIVFLALQKYYVEGVTGGAVKG